MSFAQFKPLGHLSHPDYDQVLLYENLEIEQDYLIQKNEHGITEEKKTLFLQTLDNRIKIKHQNLLIFCFF